MPTIRVTLVDRLEGGLLQLELPRSLLDELVFAGEAIWVDESHGGAVTIELAVSAPARLGRGALARVKDLVRVEALLTDE